MITLEKLLTTMVHHGGSDLHIKANSPPLIRVRGELLPLNVPPLTPEESKTLSYADITDVQRARFEIDHELDFSYVIPDVSRFRGNVFMQRGFVQSVFRAIPLQIKSMTDLQLPAVCRFFAERPRGLVVVTGPAGSGKSTTQAAMIDYINENFSSHIMTIEDPVEFVHTGKKALINQRELDRDTHSFSNALRAVLRQDPDVILIGEMRDLETVSLAITAAETGHLVFGTLHTTDAVQTIDRIVDVFPQHQQQQIRMQLSVNLVGVISQTLVTTVDGLDRAAAFETLVGVPSVRSLIREGKSHQIASLIQTGMKQGMMTLDQSLATLVKTGRVKYETALERCSNVLEFKALASTPDEHHAADAHHQPGEPHDAAPAEQPGAKKGPFGFRR